MLGQVSRTVLRALCGVTASFSVIVGRSHQSSRRSPARSALLLRFDFGFCRSPHFFRSYDRLPLYRSASAEPDVLAQLTWTVRKHRFVLERAVCFFSVNLDQSSLGTHSVLK